MNKTVWFYWSRSLPLSYMRFLSALSFKFHNPDWKINVLSPKDPLPLVDWGTGEHIKRNGYEGYDYFPYLEKIGCEVTDSVLSLPTVRSEVHRCDILRWMTLYEYGGLFSDFDIFYTRSFEPWWDNIDFLVRGPMTKKRMVIMPIGFLYFHKPKGKLGSCIMDELSISLASEYRDYQKYGRLLLEEAISRAGLGLRLGKDYDLLPMETVYPFGLNWKHWCKFFQPGSFAIHPDTIGFHWFGGHKYAWEFERKVTHENIDQYQDEVILLRFMNTGPIKTAWEEICK